MNGRAVGSAVNNGKVIVNPDQLKTVVDAADINIALDHAFGEAMRAEVGEQEWERRLDDAAYAAQRCLIGDNGD